MIVITSVKLNDVWVGGMYECILYCAV